VPYETCSQKSNSTLHNDADICHRQTMTRPGLTERTNQRYAVAAGFLGWTFDAFDFFILTFVIGDVAKTFARSRPDIALTITLALAMRPLGAVIFGVMADRIGRRVPLMLNVLFYALISVLSGLAPNYRTFLILRMLFGVALGGQWGVGAALALESVPSKWRGLFSGLVQEGYTFGNLLAALAFRTVYPRYGWRALFYLGGVPAILSLFIFSKVKESPVWQEHRTDWKSYGRTAFQHWRRFLYFVLLMSIVAFMAHGTQDMYPTFLQHGRMYSARTTADITIISMIGALLGGLVFGFFSDKLGRKRAMVTAALGGLMVVPLWIAAPNIALIALGVFLMQFFVQGTAGIVPAHMNELTPGSLRGFFPGLAYQIGVLCASSITYFEAVLGEHLTYAQAMGTLAAIVLLLGSVIFGLGPEKKGIAFSKAQL
jgi:SHS family lactate transporter-like MFS transporter